MTGKLGRERESLYSYREKVGKDNEEEEKLSSSSSPNFYEGCESWTHLFHEMLLQIMELKRVRETQELGIIFDCMQIMVRRRRR